MAIKLLIADDHEVVRCGIRSLVAGTDIEVVGEAESGREAQRLAERLEPDVVLLDLRMPDGDGLSALVHIRKRRPQLPVLILSTYDNPTYIARAHALGAAGFLLKGLSRDELLDAIRLAAQGEALWSRSELRRATIARPAEIQGAAADAALTERELEILRYLAMGLTNKELARTLRISQDTVKEHVQNVLRKTGVTDRTQAAVWAVRHGLV
jgi:DNA-binding NarL/FixJ family response regulator